MTPTTVSSKASSSAILAAVPVEEKHQMVGDVVKQLDGSQRPLIHNEPKGRNVSGRSWKVRPQKRASTLIKTKVNNQCKSWETRQAEKQQRQEALALQQQLKDEKRQRILDKKQRRLDQEKRRAENELKSMSIQVLNHKTASTKIKGMSKKQLRQIKKSRMNTKTGVVEYVSPYAKS